MRTSLLLFPLSEVNSVLVPMLCPSIQYSLACSQELNTVSLDRYHQLVVIVSFLINPALVICINLINKPEEHHRGEFHALAIEFFTDAELYILFIVKAN